MKLRWSDVRDKKQGVRLKGTVELPNLAKENRQVIALEPIEVDLNARVVSDTLTVSGSANSCVVYRCSRCLTDYSDELSTGFSLQFVRTENGEPEEKDERIPAAGDTMDLDSYLEQEILLAMPYIPLCKEECAGLCPVCGTDRNQQVCECDTERIDPRLADLAKWLNEG